MRAEGAKWIAEAIKRNSSLLEIKLKSNNIRFEEAKCIVEATRQNSRLQVINLSNNKIGADHDSQIAELLKENILKEKMNHRKFICAFTEYRKALIRLRFDKMILKFVYYPIIGVTCDDGTS